MRVYFILCFGVFFHLNVFGQELCDTVSKDISYALELPKSNISMIEIESKFNEIFIPSDYNLKKGKIIAIAFTINCKGETLNYQVFTVDNEMFNEKVIEFFKNYVSWTPPGNSVNLVDIRYSLTIKVLKNSFKIQNKKR